MGKLSEEKILEQFEKSGALMYDATLNGDYRINNKEGKKLLRFFKMFEVDEHLAQKCISYLMKSPNVVLRTDGAAYCLALKYNIENAETVLREIADNKDNRIFAFNAKMVLKVWKESGELKIYSK